MNNTREVLITVGLEEEDHQTLARAANGFGCEVIGARTIQEATQLLNGGSAPVIVCWHALPDGDWRDVLQLSAMRKPPAKVIVVSRLADNRLWSEVLNLGGYDLLAAPLDEREVSHVVGWACDGSGSGEQGIEEEEPLEVPCL